MYIPNHDQSAQFPFENSHTDDGLVPRLRPYCLGRAGCENPPRPQPYRIWFQESSPGVQDHEASSPCMDWYECSIAIRLVNANSLLVHCQRVFPSFSKNMHSSIFPYPITRPYPFQWFTPVVIIGGVILTVIFTLLNFSSSVYYTKAFYTTNPNATIEKLNARYVT